MTLKKLDKLNKDYSVSGSKLKASTTNRLIEKTNLELAKLKEQDNQIEQQVEQLKEHQLQKGMALGLYNEDGTPKDTDGKFYFGNKTNNNPYSLMGEKTGLAGLSNPIFTSKEFDENTVGRVITRPISDILDTSSTIKDTPAKSNPNLS